jgi:hypothetical protein
VSKRVQDDRRVRESHVWLSLTLLHTCLSSPAHMPDISTTCGARWDMNERVRLLHVACTYYVFQMACILLIQAGSCAAQGQ